MRPAITLSFNGIAILINDGKDVQLHQNFIKRLQNFRRKKEEPVLNIEQRIDFDCKEIMKFLTSGEPSDYENRFKELEIFLSTNASIAKSAELHFWNYHLCENVDLRFNLLSLINLAQSLRAGDITVGFSSLEIGKKDDGKKELTEIFESAKKNPRIKTINLSSNYISLRNIETVIEGINSNTNLRVIELDINEIDDDAVYKFAESLRENLTLEKVNLKNNNFNEHGSHGLAISLCVANAVRKHFGKNPLTIETSEDLPEISTTDQERLIETIAAPIIIKKRKTLIPNPIVSQVSGAATSVDENQLS